MPGAMQVLYIQMPDGGAVCGLAANECHLDVRRFDAFFQLIDGDSAAAEYVLWSAHRAMLEVEVACYACGGGGYGSRAGEADNLRWSNSGRMRSRIGLRRI